MVGVHGVQVGQGPGHVLRDVEREVPALRNVEKLHAHADPEDRHPSLGHLADQLAVEVLTPRVQHTNRGVDHETVAARVEVGTTDHYHALDRVENATDVLVVLQQRQDNWDGPHPARRRCRQQVRSRW